MNGDLILNVTVMGLGMHLGAWRHRPHPATDYLDLDYYRAIGRIAERGCLHAVFLADTLAVSEENFERPNLGAMDPITVLAASTRDIGLVATASTSYNEPFNLARRLATLDHISRGRAAWNVVTTFVPDVAGNLGDELLPPHAARYARAEEFVDVVIGLWESWDQDALVGDRSSGLFADSSKVKAIDHRGPLFSVRGPSTLPRSAQGRPVLFQAGASAEGRALAARVADVAFTAQNTMEGAKAFRTDLHGRATALGRAPSAVKVLPGLLPILGGTEAEASQRKDELDALAGDAELRKLALRVGVPISDLALDRPLPLSQIQANQGFRGSQGFQAAAVGLATAENLTVREILYRNGGGHLQIVGTPEQVADTIDLWHRDGAADGFNLMIDELPSGLEDFVDQVIPLLQRRGIFRNHYTGGSLRSNLGLGA
ncbi:LLM class flavin-dependent oxidoreductase [Beijerinckia sp. L45]|uniref:LLM class flavin-dependent oxidoreductase n=1 Tax=Beijerinckia sp. L45 TaxID=1641855 RepID=UPI00131C78F0|nr:LLM class flavin-dependent oxidoreductase [Beijerinckia sp. L45]